MVSTVRVREGGSFAATRLHRKYHIGCQRAMPCASASESTCTPSRRATPPFLFWGAWEPHLRAKSHRGDNVGLDDKNFDVHVTVGVAKDMPKVA
jgi:hypothetical protein